jgi:hypothetical protein
MGGFPVVEIHCDNEFQAALDQIATIQSPPICINYSNPQEHVPEAERNNRVIKERVRACYHRLSYVHLPRTLTKYMVIECTKKLNYFPVQNGVSKYYSPRMILHQQNINFDKHCNMFWGVCSST